VTDTGGKFSAGVNDAAGQFATGVNGTDGSPSVANIFADFLKRAKGIIEARKKLK
jgi:hypothetical protein